jgi:hypothetical protein
MVKKPVTGALTDFLDYMTSEKIGGGTCLREKIRVYVPTCYGKCNTDAERVRARMTKLFKGSTTWRGTGSWYDDKGNLVDEPIMVVESAHGNLCGKEAKIFVNIIQDYAKSAKQESISIENGFSDFYIGAGERFKKEHIEYEKTKKRR